MGRGTGVATACPLAVPAAMKGCNDTGYGLPPRGQQQREFQKRHSIIGARKEACRPAAAATAAKATPTAGAAASAPGAVLGAPAPLAPSSRLPDRSRGRGRRRQGGQRSRPRRVRRGRRCPGWHAQAQQGRPAQRRHTATVRRWTLHSVPRGPCSQAAAAPAPAASQQAQGLPAPPQTRPSRQRVQVPWGAPWHRRQRPRPRWVQGALAERRCHCWARQKHPARRTAPQSHARLEPAAPT